MGTGIIALIIGLLLGIGIAYWVLQQRLEQQEKEIQSRLQKQRDELEQDHERRMRAAVQTVQADWQKRLQAKENELARAIAAREQDPISPTPEPAREEETDSSESSTHPLTPVTPTDYEPQEGSQLIEQTGDRESESDPNSPVAFTDIELEKSLQPPEENSEKERETEPIESDREEVVSTKNTAFDLKQKIIAWGNSRQLVYISQLIQYIRYPIAEIRECVAVALGKICAEKAVRLEIETAIGALEILASDPEISVRQQAIEALGKIKSEKIIPLLLKGLRDADRDVVQFASIAIQKFKSYPMKRKPKVWVKREMETEPEG